MTVTATTFRQVALEDDENQWELVCGRLVRRPSMTMPHNEVAFELSYHLRRQLEGKPYRVRSQAGHVRTPAGTIRVPDVAVIPEVLAGQFRGSRELEEYADPLPFVAEVWSRSTGDYDIDTKFPEYRQRGDAEIWRIQPYERSVTAWRRQPDGSYAESTHADGIVAVESLPGVAINLAALFAFT